MTSVSRSRPCASGKFRFGTLLPALLLLLLFLDFIRKNFGVSGFLYYKSIALTARPHP